MERMEGEATVVDGRRRRWNCRREARPRRLSSRLGSHPLKVQERSRDPEKLEELGNVLRAWMLGIPLWLLFAKSFSHMLNLANLAEEVQIVYQVKEERFCL
ncbi:hypothetical protein QQ045_014015 [Rhodiola kirilowii]